KRLHIVYAVALQVGEKMAIVGWVRFKSDDSDVWISLGEVKADNPDVCPNVNYNVARLELDLAQPVLIPPHLVFDYLRCHRLRPISNHQVDAVDSHWLEASSRLDATLYVDFDLFK